MKPSKNPGPKPRVSHATWSSRLTRIGATVTLRADLTGNAPEGSDEIRFPSARFVIHEYSGRPPQEGGGFRIVEIKSIDVDVKAGTSTVSTTWMVTPEEEHARDGEVPEYRFTVEWAGTKAVSKLLKLGEVTKVRWSPVAASNPVPKGYGDCEVRIDEGEPVGVEVLTHGLQGFVCDVEIHEQGPGSVSVPIAKLRGIPIRSGAARARWVVPQHKATELSGARLQLVARLRHGSKTYTPRRSRSKRACFITPRLVYFALY